VVHIVKSLFKINKYANYIVLLSVTFQISSVNSSTIFDVDVLARNPYLLELKMSFAFKNIKVLARKIIYKFFLSS